MNRSSVLAVLLATAPTLGAQNPCEGNGLGVTLAVSPAYLGEPLQIDMASPASPGGFGLLAYAGQVGPITVPGIGPSCLDVFSSPFGIIPLALDGAGEAHVAPLMPSDPTLIGAPPLFLSAAAIVGAQIGLAKTVPIWFAQHDAWFPAGTLSAPRGFLRATALGDGPTADRIGVFVSGGGDQSMVEPGSKADTWLFEPFTRTFSAGPPLSVPRNFHTQTRLADGRILIAGGCDASGVVHASAELYDPATNQIVPAASMTAPRSGHAATLLQDGRVLVSGGLADFQNAKTAFKAALDTSQDTVEIFDPVLNAWTSVASTMASSRTGHTQARWHDGRVLIAGGVSGGEFYSSIEQPEFTYTVEWFEPATLSFAAAESIPIAYTAAFHGSAFDASGRLVIAGGIWPQAAFGPAVANTGILAFDGVAWSAGFASLDQAAALPTLGQLPNGHLMAVGGFQFIDDLAGIAQVIELELPAQEHFLAPIGKGLAGASTAPRGGHAMVELFDGTFLVVGGMHGSSTTPVGTWALDDAWIYAP